jgi:hypothetical protein
MTPEQWQSLPWDAGRTGLARILDIPEGPCRTFALAPFRFYRDEAGTPMVAAAIGCPPHMNPRRMAIWTTDDISDILLLDPAANSIRIAGEADGSARTIFPADIPDRLHVYRDGLAFFRAWAASRFHAVETARETKAKSFTEPRDSFLPGALCVGGLDNTRWASVGARSLIAAAGIAPGALSKAIIASAQLPNVEGEHGARG